MDKSVLNEATAPDDSPTPGYMLVDISKMTLANYSASQQLQEYLINRIKKDNHNTKYKCLVIIRHVCRTGRPEFKREIARTIDSIKDCLQYRGPPDPLRGEEIYRRVRDAAKEAMDAIYDSQMPVTTSAVAAANRIQGMGGGYADELSTQQKNRNGSLTGSILSSVVNTISSLRDSDGPHYTGHPGATSSFTSPSSSSSSYSNQTSGNYNGNNSQSNSYSSSASSSSGMVGLGNPNFKDPRDYNEKSWVERAADVASQVSSSSIASISGKLGFFDQKKPLNDDFGYTTNRGPNAFGASGNYSSSSGGYGAAASPGQQWTSNGSSNNQLPQQSSHNSNSDNSQGNSNVYGKAGIAAQDGEYEKATIEGLCDAAGLKAIPPEEKLKAFMLTAPTLSAEIIGCCLLDMLNSDAWQSRSKALQVIYTIAKAKGCESHIAWWMDNSQELHALLSDGKSSVRQNASKALKALKIDFTVQETAATSTSTNRSASSHSSRFNGGSNDSGALIDLLGNDDMVAASDTFTDTKSLNSNTGVASGQSVFDFIEGSISSDSSSSSSNNSSITSSNSSAKPAAVSGFDFMKQAPVAPDSIMPAVQPKNLDVFDFLSIGDTASVTIPVLPVSLPLAPQLPLPSAISPYNNFATPSYANTSGSPLQTPQNMYTQQLQYQQYPQQQQQYPQQQYPQQPQYPQQQQLYQQQQAPYGVNMAMGNIAGTKKVIPNTDTNSNSSSFSFMAGPQSMVAKGSVAVPDSFSFVADEIKASSSKK